MVQYRKDDDMNKKLKVGSRRMIAVTSVLVAIGGATVVDVVGQPAVAGGYAAVFRREPAPNIPLPAAGSARAVVVKVPLPAGVWLITAKANGVNFSPENYVRCALYSRGVVVGVGTTTHLGSHPSNVGTYVGDLTTMGVLRTASPTVVSLECSHDYSTTSLGDVYVEDGAVSAVRPGPINGG
jgi:hypothetical protein